MCADAMSHVIEFHSWFQRSLSDDAWSKAAFLIIQGEKKVEKMEKSLPQLIKKSAAIFHESVIFDNFLYAKCSVVEEIRSIKLKRARKQTSIFNIQQRAYFMSNLRLVLKIALLVKKETPAAYAYKEARTLSTNNKSLFAGCSEPIDYYPTSNKEICISLSCRRWWGDFFYRV